jgi:hypothetical protein
MNITLSTRAYKYLRKIDRSIGLQHTDEEVHEIGTRLLHLCQVVLDSKEREERRLRGLLAEVEIRALRVLDENLVNTGRLCSARALANALGYKSSRSGHLILQRLLCKGLLLKRAGQFVFSQKYEWRLECDGNLPVLENKDGKDGDGDLSLNFQCGASE